MRGVWRHVGAALVMVLLVGTTTLAAAQSEAGQAWIDAPLGFEVETVIPIRVVAHAADPTGVEEIRLDVNGETLAANAVSGETLETAEFLWTPTASGVYLLEAFGLGSGAWGEPGSVAVTVDLDDDATATTQATSPSTNSTTTASSSTTTSTPSVTTTPTTTSTTTPSTTTTTECALGVPTPTGPTGTQVLATVNLTWVYSGCALPEEFEVQVSKLSDFVRLEWQSGVSGQDQSTFVTVPDNCTTYYWRIRTYHLGIFGMWSNTASFLYQGGRC